MLYLFQASLTADSIPQGNSLTVTMKKDVIKTSEKGFILIKLIYKQDLIPVIPSFENLLKPVVLENVSEKGERSDEYYIRNFEVTLDHLLPGDYLLNPITITLKKDGKVIQQLKSDFIPLKIDSSLIKNGDYLEDFKKIQNRSSLLLISGISFFVLIIAAFFIYVFLKNRKEKIPVLEKDFRKRLEILRETDKDKIYYESLKSLVKEFLDNKIFLSIQSSTTEEIIHMIEASPLIDKAVKESLFDFLKRCDHISFDVEVKNNFDREQDLQFVEDFFSYIDKQTKMEDGV